MLRVRAHLLFFASESRGMGLFLGAEKGLNSRWAL